MNRQGGPLAHDLFVAYAEADRGWVHGYLIPALGLPPTGVLTRDGFRPGAPVAEEFERAVTTSRFSAVVLSPAFLADEWSTFGEQLASHASVDGGRDRLIPVLRREVSLPLRVEFRVRLDCTDPARWEPEAARLRALLGRPEPAPEDLTCPYLGMVPFSADDARFFYGREDEVAELGRRLRHQHLVAVIGPSGSGKSSLLSAGVLPRLAQDHGDAWLVRSLRPGAAPVQALGEALGGATSPEDAERLVGAVLASHPCAQRLAVVVDQLEEVFAQAPRPERVAFLAILDALRRVDRCVVVAAMRADFYPDLMASPLWPLSPGERAEVASLAGAALARAIECPAAAVGVHLEPGLLERLLADAADEPGVLPLVQETMVLLWERRRRRLLTRAAYEALGVDGQSGLAVALATKADATLAVLSPVQQAVARRIFLRLVQLGEGRDDTRRRQPVVALRAVGEDPSLFDSTLAHLTDHRLLTLSGGEDGGPTTADLAHEALIAGWPTLRRWVHENCEGLRIQRQLADDAHAWEALDRDPGALYRGARLVVAGEWGHAHADELNALERAFLEASRAQEVSELEAAKTRARRFRRLAAGLGVVLVVALVATAFAVRQTGRARAEARTALSRQLAAQAVADLDGQLPRSLLLSLEALRAEDTAEARNALLAGLQHASQIVAFLYGNAGLVASVDFSPDGEILASGSADGTVILWDVETRQQLGTPLIGHRDRVKSVAFSPDGEILASGSADGTVILWDVETRQQLGEPLKGHTDEVERAAFSPNSKTLASGSSDGTVILWDVETRQQLGEPLKGHTNVVKSVAFSPDGQMLASGSDDSAVILWDVQARQQLGQSLMAHDNDVWDVAFSPDGKTLASGGHDESVILWDVQTRQQLGEPLTGHRGPVYSLAFSPDGKTLASGSRDGTVILWDVQARQQLGEPLAGHDSVVTDVAFSPDGKTLASGGSDDIVVLWNAEAPPRMGGRLAGHTSFVSSVVFSPDGKTLASGSANESVILWDVASGQRRDERLADHTNDVKSVAFSPDGKTLASGNKDGTVILWDVQTHQQLSEPLTGHRGLVHSVAFSPDGKTLASGSDDRTVILWDVQTRQQLSEPMIGHAEIVKSVAFSPDGQMLASGSYDRTVILWDVRTRQRLGESLTGHGSSVTSVAFSPDGKTLASGGLDNVVILWDVETHESRGESLTGHRGGLTSVAFSPDGKTLASSSYDNTVIRWDVAARQQLGEPLTGHNLPVTSVAFSPDGQMLASGSYDGTVILWDVSFDFDEAWRDSACALSNRNLSRTEWERLFGPGRRYERTCPGLPSGVGAPEDAPAAAYDF